MGTTGEMMARIVAAVLVLLALAAVQADDKPYFVKFEVDNLDGESGKTGSFVMEVHPDWAPLGAARMKTLVDEQFFSGVRFFRVINNFMAQFGISGDPKIAAKWRNEKMVDDPVKESNTRALCHLQHRARILALLRCSSTSAITPTSTAWGSLPSPRLSRHGRSRQDIQNW